MVDLDAESDASCQASQNNPRPAAPHQLPQPSVRSCNPSNNDQWLCETVSLYFDELIERLLELLDAFPEANAESDGDRTVTWYEGGAGGRSTSVHIRVDRGRSRSPRRQGGEPQAAAIPHAESHLGIAPAEGKEGKD